MAAATATSSGRLLDPSKPGKYPVIIGDSLAQRSIDRPLYAGIRYNHKPSPTTAGRTIKINRASKPASLGLSITDHDEPPAIYRYEGSRAQKKALGSYMLVFDPSKQAFALDKVDTSFNFNLKSAPGESGAKKASQQYPQLEMATNEPVQEETDLFSGSEDEAGPDESNPYDFRHWMKEARQSSPKRGEPAAKAPEKTAPQKAKPKSKVSSRSKSGLRGEVSKSKAKPAPRAALQTQHRGRKSPERDDADDESSKDGSADEGGLIIEMEPEAKRAKRRMSKKNQGLGIKHWSETDRAASDDLLNPPDDELTIEMEPDSRPRRSLAAAFQGRLTPGGRPISLRSASSVSPASHRGISPAPDGDNRNQMDSSSESDVDEVEGEKERHTQDNRAADADVDNDLKLPSPISQREDDDMDLAAELAQALESEAAGARKEASESESEEE